jgi:hypothetical protein
MKNVVRQAWVCAVMATLVVGLTAKAAEEQKPLVQLAILLDTSNSMDGLIDQAKTQLWKIVNEFIMAKRDGQRPELRVALYEYGNNGLPASEGHIRMVLPLTTDLDKVSEELFALKTNGGREYCGKVIEVATAALDWAGSNDDLKVIFIAGNEPFTQGDVDYRKACKDSIAKGIIVNTIFCGPHEQGIRTNWKDGADLADGSYMNIDQDRRVVHIAAPQDKRIAELGVKLNQTYLYYGVTGKESAERQAQQDANAMRELSSGSHVERSVTKASAHYRNVSWDLVDAVREGKIELKAVKDEELPEEMQNMTLEQRKAHVEENATLRKALQEEISKLNEERKRYVAGEMKKLTESGGETLEAAMIKLLRNQAERKNFKFQ